MAYYRKYDKLKDYLELASYCESSKMLCVQEMSFLNPVLGKTSHNQIQISRQTIPNIQNTRFNVCWLSMVCACGVFVLTAT